MTRWRSILAVLVWLVPLVTLLAVGWSGFCFSQWRYVPEREFIEIAVARRADDIKALAGDQSSERIAAFLAQKPNCCRIGSDPVKQTALVDRLFGGTIWVYLIYERPEERVKHFRAGGSFYRAFAGMTSCGRVVELTSETLTREQAERLQVTK